ncbi:MAG TPA: lipid-binding SYLF domain-containing protein [Terriglobales bacterium]|nr:lipid-binding SYLF domain-containing protein [Terriglobales bacterium]
MNLATTLRPPGRARLPRAAEIVAAVACLAVLAPAAISTRENDLARIKNATEIIHTIANGPGRRVAASVLRSGTCVAIIPGYKTFALGIGGSYGKGVAMCRHAGRWGAPIFVTIGGASFGPQIGGESADVVLVFQSYQGLESMLNNKARIGVSAAGAAGPIGRRVAAATDAAMRAQALTYGQSRGLYIGANVDGAIVQPDETGNRALYGHAYWQDVLEGRVAAPADARALVSALDNSPWTGTTALAARRRAASGIPASQVGLPTLNRLAFTGAPLPVFAGINLVHQNTSIGLGGFSIDLGFLPSPTRYPWLRLMAEGGRVRGSEQLLNISVTNTVWTVLAGPRVEIPKRLFAPFAEALFGYGHSGANAAGSQTFDSFAWKAGGGINLNISRAFSVRIFELDFLHTNFNSHGETDGLISGGLTFHF